MYNIKITRYLLYFLLVIPLLCVTYANDCSVSKDIVNVVLKEDYPWWDSDDYEDVSNSDEKRITYQYKIRCKNVDINSDLSLESHVNGSNKEQANLSIDIRIENSKLDNISKTLLKNMNSVTSLQITSSHVNYIEPESINMMNLTSINLKNNSLTEIQNGTFKNLPKLKDISLDFNKIKIFESIKNCPRLSTLYLDHNELTSIDENHFENLVNLNFLNLSNNHISFIHADAFKNLINLFKLDLNNNQLETIPNNVFTNLHSLRFLDVSHNNIKEITFEKVDSRETYLYYIWYYLNRDHNLEYNNLISIPKNISNMNQMNLNIYLNNNNISSIQLDDFKNLNVTRSLNLANNTISSIEIGAFKDMTNLRLLNIANNKIKTLKSGVFTGLNNMQTLNLSYNEFITFDSIVFYTMETLREIDFSKNYLHSLDTTDLHFSGLEYISLDFHNIGCHSLINYIKAFKAHGITIRKGNNFLTENVNGISCTHTHRHHTTIIPSTTISTTETTKSTTTTSTTTTITTKNTPVTEKITDAPIIETSTVNFNISGKAYEVSQSTNRTAHTAIITTSIFVVIAGIIIAAWFGRKYYYRYRNTDNETNYRLVNVMESTENSRY